jgi:TonB-dependent receptor
MSIRRAFLAVLIFLALLDFPSFAQSGRGTVTGLVADAQGGGLQGAKITLDPGGATSLSDVTGQFTVNNVASGDYALTVSYSGFDLYTQKITVSAGQVLRVDAVMKVAANKQDVQVYAGRLGGEVEAINRTFTADNIINVLPADVIKSLPNANVADAIGRLSSVTLERDEGEGKYVQVRGTEPRLTNTMIDGVNIASAETVRQIKLDIIPSDLVESVQINKTLQANMPGDGIGGSVDLRTKSAGDRPTVALESTAGYTPIIGGRPLYQFDGTVGRRFNEKKLGILFGGSYDWNGRGINDVEPGPLLLGGYDERDYQYYRSRLGFAGTVDYRFSDTSSIYLKGLYSLFHNYGNRWDYNISTNFLANGQPDPATGTVGFGAEIRRPVQDIGSLQLGGHHVLSRMLFAWDVESSVGRTRDKGYSDATFAPVGSSNLNAIPFTLDNSNPLVPKLNAPAGYKLFDPAQYEYVGQRVNNYYNPEVDLGFGASLGTSYMFGGHAGTFEFGGRFRNVHKFANQDTLYTVPTAASGDPSLSMTRFLNGFSDPNYYGNSYTFGPAVDYDKVTAFTAVTLDTNRKHPSGRGQNFNLIEKVSAGYVMNTIDLGKFRVITGLRFEETSDKDNGTTVPGSPNVAKNGSYLDVLPSASVRYGLTSSKGIRLVYGRGLSRPNFSDLVSFASIAPGGVRTTSSIGNPNLKAEHADNLDLLYEQNLNPVGLLQAGIFYKRLSDPIVPLNSTLNAGTPNQIIQTQPQNAGSAYLYGFEIAFQQHFTYLPGLLSGAGLSANYGYTASQLTWPKQMTLPNGSLNIDRTDHPDLLRQAPHTWNISPTYDKKNLSVRLGLSYNAANIFSYNYSDSNGSGPISFASGTATGGGIHGPNGDTYLYSHLQVDLQGTYKLPKGFTAVAYGLNLNNEVFGFYNGSEIYPIQREFYKPTFGGGLRWSPSRE